MVTGKIVEIPPAVWQALDSHRTKPISIKAKMSQIKTCKMHGTVGKNVNINAIIGTLGTRPMARRWSNAPEVRAKLGNLQGFSSVNLSACSFVKFT